ncbi:MAG: hypothetical protein HC880_21800 [Bacteroidia bacterium]|nr:hypothetical protein [Bacteroidia bacterium]
MKETKNLFISPLSVGYALAMTLNGATGTTREEIKEVLGLASLSDEELNRAYRYLRANCCSK